MEPIPARPWGEHAAAHDVYIRLATSRDVESILAVYAPYIYTPITFEETVPTLEEFRERVTTQLAEYPYLVAERNGAILGYAYAHAQAERAAYDWNAELSIYLTPESAGHGLGTILYRALIDLLRAQGVKCAYARVTIPNDASEHLHAAFGFELMGTQRNAGYTCEAWRDVAWYTLALSAFTTVPAPRRAFCAVDASVVHTVIEQANCALAEQVKTTKVTRTAKGAPAGVAAAEKATQAAGTASATNTTSDAMEPCDTARLSHATPKQHHAKKE